MSDRRKRPRTTRVVLYRMSSSGPPPAIPIFCDCKCFFVCFYPLYGRSSANVGCLTSRGTRETPRRLSRRRQKFWRQKTKTEVRCRVYGFRNTPGVRCGKQTRQTSNWSWCFGGISFGPRQIIYFFDLRETVSMTMIYCNIFEVKLF